MARTVQPSGHMAVDWAGIAFLVASSSTFQTLVGTPGDAAAAFSHVFFEADDSEESGSARPRAIVVPPAGQAFGWKKVSGQEFRRYTRLHLSIEALPDPATASETPLSDRLFDELLSFMNTAQGIIDDCQANQGVGNGYASGMTHPSINEMRVLSGPATAPLEVRASGQQGETPEYFLGVTLELILHG